MLEKDDMIDTEIELEDTDAPEDIDLEDVETQVGDKIKKLRDTLKKCKAEKQHHLEELQRAKADFLNARKRLEEDRIRDKKRTTIHFIEELLPLCDSFHMAMSNEKVWNEVPEVWRKGVESIYTQLQEVLKAHNVAAIQPLGEDFDPNIHDAMGNLPVGDEKDHHTVMQVIQPGYIMKNEEQTEVIRPARVMVGEFTNS